MARSRAAVAWPPGNTFTRAREAGYTGVRGAPVRYEGQEPDGSLLARAAIPIGLSLQQIGSEHALVVVLDALGVPFVEIREIERRER